MSIDEELILSRPAYGEWYIAWGTRASGTSLLHNESEGNLTQSEWRVSEGDVIVLKFTDTDLT